MGRGAHPTQLGGLWRYGLGGEGKDIIDPLKEAVFMFFEPFSAFEWERESLEF